MNLKTSMMKHQEQAFNKLKDIKACALWMDMGTGKTRTTLEFIDYRLEAGKIDKVFWICPCSTKKNLSEDIEKHSIFSKSIIEKYNDEFICIIGTESISQSDRIYLMLNKLIEENPNSMIIVDESHMIKNHKAVRTERILKLGNKVKYRAILTGTPITQGIWDLFTQMYFLHPKILGYNSFFSFAKNHLEYSEKFPGMIVRCHNTDYITKKVNPYIYQVTKKECLDLPPKTYSNSYFEISDEQHIVYQRVKEFFIDLINPENFCSDLIFNMLGYLQRVASGFIDLDLDYVEKINDYDYEKQKEVVREVKHNLQAHFRSTERAKLVLEEVEKMPEEAKKIIWYRYNSDLELMREVFDIKYAMVNGNVSQKQRETNISEFKTSKDTNVLLVNINTGSLGLNLQEANYMIYYNSTFDYAKRIQSEDRIYRIGQNNNCHIIDILSDTGIDQRIEAATNSKSSLIREIRERIKKIKDDKEAIEKFKKEILNDW